MFTEQFKSRVSTNYVNFRSNHHPIQNLSKLFKLDPINRYAIFQPNIGNTIFFPRPKILPTCIRIRLDRKIVSPYPSTGCHPPRLFSIKRIPLPQANQPKYL